MSGKKDVWMPLYIADYLADTTHLTPAQHGAYLLLIMVYWRLGPLPDNDTMLARMTRCDGRQWSSSIGPTVREFFHARGGKLHHKRIDLELAKAASISETRRQAGRQSRGKRAPDEAQKQQLPVDEGPEITRPGDTNLRTPGATFLGATLLHNDRPNDLNSLGTHEANAKHLPTNCLHTRASRTRGLSQSQSPSQKVLSPGTSPRQPTRVAAGRGSRLPADWNPSEADREYARKHGLDPGTVAERFCDFWIAQAGAKGLKADWPATWRTWCRREMDFSPARGGRRFATAAGAQAQQWGLEGFHELDGPIKQFPDDEPKLRPVSSAAGQIAVPGTPPRRGHSYDGEEEP